MNIKKYFTILAFALITAFTGSTVQAPPPNPLQVHYINVLQGDSALIISPAGKTLLIDAGDNRHGDEVVEFMQEHNVTSLDYMVSSHYHTDHIGGSDYVLYNVPVDTVYDRGGSYDSQTFWDYVQAAGEKRTVINVGGSIDLGSGINTYVVQSDYGTSENDKSIVLKLSYGTTDFLFGGDSEQESESGLVNKNIGDIEIYKVHHHGSRTSSTWQFLQQTTPELAVISVGEDNNYGHPHKQTVQNLKDIGSQICRTDKDGDVSVYSDGTIFWYSSSANPDGCGTNGNGKGGGKGNGKKPK